MIAMNNTSPSTISSANQSIAVFLRKLSLRQRLIACMLLAAAMSGCSSVPKSPAEPPPPEPPAQTPAATAPAPVSVPPPGKPPQAIDIAHLTPATFGELPGWQEDRLQEALVAFIRSCDKLRGQAQWKEPCSEAMRIAAHDDEAVRAFFETGFVPHAVSNTDGSMQGTITGYYEPILRGSRQSSTAYRHPIYSAPEDMLVVDLGEVYPELKPMRLRGRLDGRRVVPYYTRAQIENGNAPLSGREIAWIDDAVDLFFLHIQGSGQVMLDSGQTIRVSYADQNGHPYRSVGRLLVERGELTLDQASMQGIRAWGQKHPERLPALLQENASYVFFRELPASGDGPPGALGVPLTPGRSLAVDPRAVPLGAPVYLSTTRPNSTTPLNRLMMAQDTGGAIKGGVRGDFYWGSGDEAGREAGRMRQSGRMWVLLPRMITAPEVGP